MTMIVAGAAASSVVLTLGVCVMLYFDPFFRRRRQSAPVAAG